MWTKLARNRYWLAFCVGVTAVMTRYDNKNVVQILFPEPQSVPTAIAQMPSPQPRIVAANTATFPNGARVTIQRKPLDSTPHIYKLTVRLDTPSDVPFMMMLKTDSNAWVHCSPTDVRRIGTKTVVNNERAIFKPAGVTDKIVYTAAWMSEAKTVAGYDVATGKWLASGIRANVSVESDAGLDFPSIAVSITLPGEFTPPSAMTSQLFGAHRTYGLVVEDKHGVVHQPLSRTVDAPEDFAYRTVRKRFDAVFVGVAKDDVKSIRLVAAPRHVIHFVELEPNTPRPAIAAPR